MNTILLSTALALAAAFSPSSRADSAPAKADVAQLITYEQLMALSPDARATYVNEVALMLVDLERMGGHENGRVYASAFEALLPWLESRAGAQAASTDAANLRCPTQGDELIRRAGVRGEPDVVICAKTLACTYRGCPPCPGAPGDGADEGPAVVYSRTNLGVAGRTVICKNLRAGPTAAAAPGAPPGQSGGGPGGPGVPAAGPGAAAPGEQACRPAACEGERPARKEAFIGAHPEGNLLCVNGGMLNQFNRTYRVCPSVRTMSWGGVNYECEGRQTTICNPLIFGVTSDNKALCVPIGSRTTEGCARLADRASRPAAAAPGGAAAAPAAAPGAHAPPAAAGALRFLDTAQGGGTAWNDFRQNLRKVCVDDQTSAKYHCAECAVIANRLARARAGATSFDLCGNPTASAPAGNPARRGRREAAP